jgi:hypothetical protein
MMLIYTSQMSQTVQVFSEEEAKPAHLGFIICGMPVMYLSNNADRVKVELKKKLCNASCELTAE